MSAYIIFIVFIIIEWILLFPNHKIIFGSNISYRQKKLFLTIVCIEMICFAGLRNTNLGADINTYLSGLEYYSSLPHREILGAELVWPFDFETGYFWLTKSAAWMSLNETEFLFLIAVLTYIPVFIFILKYSENPLISVLTYFTFSFFEYSFGIFRQMIALSIVLVGTKYIIDRKLIKYIVTIVLAMTFHTTSIIMLPFYWIYRLDFEKKLNFIFIVEIICLFCARPLIILSTIIFPKYVNYINGHYDIQGGSYLMLILFNIILIVSCSIAQKEENKDNVILRMSINATVIAVLLQILGYSMQIFGRIVSYYSIYLLLLIPILMNRCLKKNIIFIYFLMIIILIVLFYLQAKISILNPYNTIFDKI